ncbi:leucine-rich repeat-containing protein 24-like [Bacillus rossius redtenbacheri]|uniref:leucine-rich repeat-containing protein 24-like n=1 Tax=Bacillus rossius redtenbacheri TaxID=93214 RepID=UPI002FDC7D43
MRRDAAGAALVLAGAAAMLLLLAAASSAASGSCPSACACKWKGGKQTVECVDRGLITIPEGVHPETQVLDMSGNNLQVLPRDMFVRAGLLNLQRVYLRNCRVGEVDDRALNGLTNLVELDLSYNLLTFIPSATFHDVPFLRDVTLARNPIRKIDGHAFRTLPSLVKLDLSHCELQAIAPKAFEGVEQLATLKLNGNRLSELRPKTVETLSRLQGVELHDNPWVCDCRLRAVKLWLADNNIPYPVSPACAGGPARVAGRTFAELDVDDFACRPEILPASRHVEAAAGENATVLCRVGAVPPATVHWYSAGRQLANLTSWGTGQKVLIFEDGRFEKTSSLVLTGARDADTAEFYCVADNRAGTAEANFTLRVAPRAAGMATFDGGQIAGLSAVFVVLLLFVLLAALLALARLRRPRQLDAKTPDREAAVAAVEAKPAPPPPAAAARPDPPRPPSPAPLDLIRDTTAPDDARPASGEYSRALGSDSLYPSGLWEQQRKGRSSEASTPTGLFLRGSGSFGCFDASSDRTPIIGDGCEDDPPVGRATRLDGYPPDYGLPVADSPGELAPPLPSAKTLRVWQRGVPVLPPVTALKRALSSNRNSPDEGYQEGCGTDV